MGKQNNRCEHIFQIYEPIVDNVNVLPIILDFLVNLVCKDEVSNR